MQVDRVLTAALAYYDRGWCVLPVDSKKRPALRTWRRYQTERPTREQLRTWFRDDRDGVGVVLGPVSGRLACRDFDTMDAYGAWAATFPDLARQLPQVRTPRGYHVYVRSDRPGVTDLGDGEFRGGGIAVLPPSRHANGTRYTWAVPLPDGPLPELDPGAIGLLGAVGTDRERKRTEENGENRCSGGGGQLGKAEVERVIVATLPDGPGKRHRQVFRLARGLRGIVGTTDIDPLSFRPVVQEWHRRAIPYITTLDFAETWIDFLRGWPRVRCPLGINYMPNVLERAKRAAPVPLAAEYESDGLRLLAALCRELQQDSGDGPFYIANREAARLLGVPTMQANRWLFLLVAEGILSVVTKGGTADGVRKATRYRFNGQL